MRFRWNNCDKSEEQNKLLVNLFIHKPGQGLLYRVRRTYLKIL